MPELIEMTELTDDELDAVAAGQVGNLTVNNNGANSDGSNFAAGDDFTVDDISIA